VELRVGLFQLVRETACKWQPLHRLKSYQFVTRELAANNNLYGAKLRRRRVG